MFLWRNLPPGALVAALHSLMARREKPREKTRTTRAEAPAVPKAPAEVERERLDRAVIEIQSRL